MKKKQKVEKDKSERWLLTYSDLMNLLLILFIILYCSSSLDSQKATALAVSMREGFGQYAALGGDGSGTGYGGGDGSGEGTGDGSTSSSTTDDGMLGNMYGTPEDLEYGKFYQDVNKLLADSGLDAKATIVMSERGVVISFKDNVLFPSGSAELGTEANTLITQLGGLLKKLTYSSILVEGHTDSVPIHNAKFQDNMDLSTQRASNVWRTLVQSGLPPAKMASIGYGEYRPVVPNDSAANRARNRRVVISILRKTTENQEDLVSGTDKTQTTDAAGAGGQDATTADSTAGTRSGISLGD